MANISEQILDSIELLTQKYVSTANFDRTIQGTIVACVDANRGKYKIKYQDSLFYAFSQDTQKTYREKDTVYILVPDNDMSKEKTILGSAKATVSTIGNTNLSENEDLYEEIGENGIETIDTGTFPRPNIEIESLIDSDNRCEQDIYDITRAINPIEVDQDAINYSLKNATSIKAFADFKTNIDTAKYGSGSYGLAFKVTFIDNELKEVPLVYTFDSSEMVSCNPYQLLDTFVQKAKYFDYDKNALTFKSLDKITLYAQNFNTDKMLENGVIAVDNIGFLGCYKLSPEEINSCRVEIVYPNGNYFSEAFTEPKTIKARLIYKNIPVVSSKDSPIYYFWFEEKRDVDYSVLNEYCAWGGKGWRCLNSQQLVVGDDGEERLEWVSATENLRVQKEDIKIESKKYKCVILNNNITYTKEFFVYNKQAPTLELSSSLGAIIDPASKDTKISCLINGVEQPSIEGQGKGYEYSWQGNGLYFFGSSLSNKTNKTTIIKDSRVTALVSDIKTGSEIGCCAYYNGQYLGSVSMIFGIKEEQSSAYELFIVNDKQGFIYNEEGNAPTDIGAGENYVVIRPLKFYLLDNTNGTIIDGESIAGKASISWGIPKTNTLLVPTGLLPSKQDDEYYYYSGYEFSFDIAKQYSFSKYNNDILLQVEYDNNHLRKLTNFSFSKQGNLGTNGTSISCNIVMTNKALFPTITKREGLGPNSFSVNFKEDPSDGKWFNAQLTSNDTDVSSEALVINSEEWSLINDHAYNNTYKAFFYIGSLGTCSVYSGGTASPYLQSDHSRVEDIRDIIQVKVVDGYGLQYYSFQPVSSVVIQQDYAEYDVQITDGFSTINYSSSGADPQYNRAPFEIKVFNGGLDISDSLSYEWKIIPNEVDQGVANSCLSVGNQTDYKKNQFYITPKSRGKSDNYGIAVFCTILKDDAEVATVHIPIFIYFNQYSQHSVNDWDGNGIVTNEQGGYILSPQVIAGKKEEKTNLFTGVFMGQYLENKKLKTGLFGMGKGINTFFLDAETGRTTLGSPNSGQLILDPENNDELIIKSSLYEEEKDGLQINFGRNPSIKYGNGKFKVDELGHLYAEGAKIEGRFYAHCYDSTIRCDEYGFDITYKNEYMNTYIRENGFRFGGRDEESEYIKYSNGRLSLVGDFSWKRNIPSGEQDQRGEGSVTFNDSGIKMNFQSEKDSKGEYDKFVLSNSRLYLGHYDAKGILLKGLEYSSGNLTVTGTINATSGKIGGWTIGATSLYNYAYDQAERYKYAGLILDAETGSINQVNFSTTRNTAIEATSIKEKITLKDGRINFYRNINYNLTTKSCPVNKKGDAYETNFKLEGVIFTRDKNDIEPYCGASVEGAMTISSREGETSASVGGSPVILSASNLKNPSGLIVAMVSAGVDDGSRHIVIPTFIKSTSTDTETSEGSPSASKYSVKIAEYSTKLFRDKIQTGDILFPVKYLKKKIPSLCTNKKDDETVSIFEVLNGTSKEDIKEIEYETGTNSIDKVIITYEKKEGDKEAATETYEFTVNNRGKDNEEVTQVKLPSGKRINLVGF